MIYEIVYGKEGTSDYKELATPKECKGYVKSMFPMILELRYPSEAELTPKPVVFCYTKGRKCRAILSCIKWFAGRGGNYFAQHLVFENEDDLIVAGPAWLIKRRRFYIETLTDWSEREKENTGKYSWKPIIQPSDYCIGLEEKLEPHIDRIIEDIAKKWNGADVQAKFVLLFDPSKQSDDYRLDLLYELYSRINKDKRWNYPFCTFDFQRSGWVSKPPPPKWDIVFVVDDDMKTRDYFTKHKYEPISLMKGNES